MKEDKYVTHRYVSSRAKGLLLESVGTYAKKIRSRGDGAEKIENHQVGKEKFCTLFFSVRDARTTPWRELSSQSWTMLFTSS